MIEHEHGRTTEDMGWPAPGEEPAVKTIILDNKSTAMRAAQRWAREKEVKVVAGVWMWWTDGSRSDDGRVGAAAECKQGIEWRTRHSYLGTGRMEVFDAGLWAIGLALWETVKRRDRHQQHGVIVVAVFSDSQAAIRQAAQLQPGLVQRLARRINRRAQNLRGHGIANKIYWVPGHSSIHGNDEADRQANFAQDASGSRVIEWPYTSASNRARRISEGRSAAKAKWEADKCRKHFSYRLKGKTGTKRPIAMTSVKSLPTRFY